jgi:hypothetical protein
MNISCVPTTTFKPFADNNSSLVSKCIRSIMGLRDYVNSYNLSEVNCTACYVPKQVLWLSNQVKLPLFLIVLHSQLARRKRKSGGTTLEKRVEQVDFYR